MSLLPPAPGAKAAKICGILAIVFSLTCVGIPVALVLGIVALVQHHKAGRAFREWPGQYAPVPATGLVTGIIGLVLPVFLLPVIGMTSAIAIPALLSQRSRARDKVALANLTEGEVRLLQAYDQLAEEHTSGTAVPAALRARLEDLGRGTQDPWNPALPAYDFQIQVVEGLDRASLEAAARARATVLGQVVYTLELPTASQPGHLAGAVPCQMPVAGQSVVVKVVELD